MGIASLKGRDFLAIADFNREELTDLLQLAEDLKQGKSTHRCDKVLGLLFSKASTRTRVSFSVAMYQIGGQVLDLNPSQTQVGRGEPLQDTARVLDRYLDIVAIRTYRQEDLQLFADYAQIPVINALTDLEHPCQILADLQTIQANFGQLAGLTMTYLGDGNNVAHSLLIAGAMMGMNVRIATPKDFSPDPAIVATAQRFASPGTELLLTDDPKVATEDTHVIYTDVWASMGQEDLADSRIPIFQPYQVNQSLLDLADPMAIVLHCLPAHRGEEITEAVLEGAQSRVWDQAENRLHAQKALLISLLGLV